MEAGITMSGDPFDDLTEALDLLGELVDADTPCRFDHHGQCQEHHGGFAEDGCATRRAWALIRRVEETDYGFDDAAPVGVTQDEIADLIARADDLDDCPGPAVRRALNDGRFDRGESR
jgi:hypothetical protein